MKHFVGFFALVLFGGALAAGCQGQKPIPVASNTRELAGLAVSLELPKRQFVQGEQFNVVITARNMTKRPIQIVAQSGAAVHVSIRRHNGLSWQEVKRYPQAALMVMRPWTLDAGVERSFMMQLTVEPDWPTDEPLQITGQLNGRFDPQPAVTIEVLGRARP